MTSRAGLLAEIEENRLKNKKIERKPEEISNIGPETASGYDPYDNPSLGKEVRNGAELVARRRAILDRKRR